MTNNRIQVIVIATIAAIMGIEPISTIGAGDNFNAGLIYSLFKLNISHKTLTLIEKNDWQVIAQNGTRFAQQVCMSYDNYISNEFAKIVEQ